MFKIVVIQFLSIFEFGWKAASLGIYWAQLWTSSLLMSDDVSCMHTVTCLSRQESAKSGSDSDTGKSSSKRARVSSSDDDDDAPAAKSSPPAPRNTIEESESDGWWWCHTRRTVRKCSRDVCSIQAFTVPCLCCCSQGVKVVWRPCTYARSASSKADKPNVLSATAATSQIVIYALYVEQALVPCQWSRRYIVRLSMQILIRDVAVHYTSQWTTQLLSC